MAPPAPLVKAVRSAHEQDAPHFPHRPVSGTRRLQFKHVLEHLDDQGQQHDDVDGEAHDDAEACTDHVNDEGLIRLQDC